MDQAIVSPNGSSESSLLSGLLTSLWQVESDGADRVNFNAQRNLFGRISSNKEDFVLPKEEKEYGSTRFFSSIDNIPYVLRDAYKDKDLKNYTSQAFVFSQDGVIGAMNKAVLRGATVNLSVGIHHQNKMGRYEATTTSCSKDMHGKNIAGLECSPSKGESTKAVFITGSANPSDAIWPTGNMEAVVEVRGDVELTQKACRLMRDDSLTAHKGVVLNTPDKREVYSSQNILLNESRALRVRSVAKESGDDRIVWASTMNINDQAMTDALCEASQSGADTRLVVNKSALTKKGIPLVKKMADSGVNVKVFYPVDGSRIIQHKKELIRNDLYVISNANFTDEGDSQKNLETYFPCDTQLISDAKIDFERVEKKCVTLEKALELLAVTNEKKAEKKKIAAENKKIVVVAQEERKRKLPADAKKSSAKRFKSKIK